MIRKLTGCVLALGAVLIVASGSSNGSPSSTDAADESDLRKINESITVAPGRHAGDVSTVNGSIHIGADAVVGHARTVNGSLRLESNAMASSLETQNGAIEVQDGGRVMGSVHLTNGGLHIFDGADVAGDVSNVNGGMRIASAHVGGSIDTRNGNIDIGPNAHIDGGVHMGPDNSSMHFGQEKLPRVVIEPGTMIKGSLHFERTVVLYVSDRATIGGVEGATAVRFSGDHPPE